MSVRVASSSTGAVHKATGSQCVKGLCGIGPTTAVTPVHKARTEHWYGTKPGSQADSNMSMHHPHCASAVLEGCSSWLQVSNAKSACPSSHSHPQHR